MKSFNEGYVLKLIIVPCADLKIWDREAYYHGKKVPARYAYIGNYSKTCIEYAIRQTRKGHRFLILSTKYGFLEPEEEIENYNEKNFLISDEELRIQAEAIDLTGVEEIEVLASGKYYHKTYKAFHERINTITHPLQSLNRGQALAYLKKHWD